MTTYETTTCTKCGMPVVFSPTNPKKTYAFKIKAWGRKTMFFCSWNCMKDYESSKVFGDIWHPGCVRVKDFWLKRSSVVGQWAHAHHGEAERLAKSCDTAYDFKKLVAKNVRHICVGCFGLIGSTDVAKGLKTCSSCREKNRRSGKKIYARKMEKKYAELGLKIPGYTCR